MTAVTASCVPGIGWPGLPTAAGAQMLAMQWQLDQSQWWPRERLVEYQIRQIRALVAHAVAQVPYYRDALLSAGLRSPDELDVDSFRSWPILKKAEIRANEAALHAAVYPRDHGPLSEGETTGSTGMPLRVRTTEIGSFFARALVVRDHLMHGRELSRKLGTIRGGVRESTQHGWGVVNTAFQTGPGSAISLFESHDHQLDWLLREKPAYLLAPPATLRAIVLRSRQRGLRPEGLLEAMTFAAMQPSDLKALVRENWGIPVTDTYSCVEAATLAVQCPGYEHYLVQAENVYLEVLREDGMPCMPGETGRVVITPLHNFAMPLIRYELGDYAEAGGECPTGRGLPTLNRIAGRVRNMLRNPKGRIASPNIPPSLWLETPITQFRLVQHTLSEIEVQYVMDRPLSPSENERLVGLLRQSLGYPFDIRLSRVPEIERQKGDKFEEFLSLLPDSTE